MWLKFTGAHSAGSGERGGEGGARSPLSLLKGKGAPVYTCVITPLSLTPARSEQSVMHLPFHVFSHLLKLIEVKEELSGVPYTDILLKS